MRKPIIAGNWKMNKNPEEARALIEDLIPMVEDASCEVVVCPPFVDIGIVAEMTEGTNIHVGAQNMHHADSGAYTGEVSASMLNEIGVEYVIIGHSERRQYFCETDATVDKKVLTAVRNGLKPIVCVGEMLAERELGYTDVLIEYQTKIALSGLVAAQVKDIVVAYEPVWAIGTGKTATAEEAGRVCGVIRKAIREEFGLEAAEEVRILYGGSMNPGNAKELMAQRNIDGGLIGGASLKAMDFSQVVLYDC